MLELARATGTRLHLSRLSTADAVASVRKAKQDGLAVTCDVSAHHVHLSDRDIGYFDSLCHVIPPFRSERDRDALRAGLADGTVDAICSDHAPVDEDGKMMPFAESEPGATALELLLPLALKWGEDAKLPLSTVLGAVTDRPARVLGAGGGELGIGSAADICIFDAAVRVRISAEGLRSQGKNTPFLGYELPGRVRWTLVEGAVVYQANA